jgi:uncharacterized cupredoxin-like copper-binding protein
MNARILLVPALLLGALACGGGGSSSASGPATATKLSYTNPTSGEYQLKQNASLSTSTHLVLELWGPSAKSACGATVTFTLGGSGATWKNVNTTDDANTFVANGTAFDLGSGKPILKAKVSGSTLMATVAEKGLASPKALNQPLLRVAVDLQSGITAGTAITLTPGASRILLADGTMPTIAVTTSNITAQ